MLLNSDTSRVIHKYNDPCQKYFEQQTMTMTMTTLLLNIKTGYKLEYTYNMIY